MVDYAHLAAAWPYVDDHWRSVVMGDLSESRCSECGAWHWLHERLVGTSQVSPRYSQCCLDGAYSQWMSGTGDIKLPARYSAHPVLRRLLTTDGPEGNDFRCSFLSYRFCCAGPTRSATMPS